jgi:hypothetical protein
MAEEQESAVLVAIARYSPDEWFGLPSSQRTRAIYRELRQLDAAAASVSVGGLGAPHGPREI